MMAGLGIDFNPPASPPQAAPANQVIAKLRGQQGLGRSLPTERDARLNQNNAAQASTRHVRIVSAANVYHEQEEQEEYARSDEEAGQDTMDYGLDYNDEDILDEYTNPSPNLRDTDIGSSPGSQISPAPTSYTMQTGHSLGAVSSGSSTRHHDVETMQQTMPTISSKADDFESRLRNMHIEDYRPNLHLRQMHNRSYSVDNSLPASSIVATVRGNLPPASAVPTSLRRAPAMSRPRSMMELGQLYAYQSINGVDSEQLPSVQSSAISRQHSATSSSPYSIASEGSYDSSAYSGQSTAPSSAYGSAEMKPAATFMARQQSRVAGSQCSTIEEDPSQSNAIGPSSQELRKARSAISMRSQASMRGLEVAENGGGAVVTDALGGGFLAGIPFEPRHTKDLKSPPVIGHEAVTRDLARQLRSCAMSVATSRLSHAVSMPTLKTSIEQPLQRQSTLLTAGANPVKRARELDRLLAPKPVSLRSQYTAPTQSYNTMQISSQPAFSPGGTTFQSVDATGYQPGRQQTALKRKPSTVVLEQGVKGKARVELDLVLASELVVEGGALMGRMEVRVRKDKDGEGVVWLGAVKARIVGFEELNGEDARHVFYHHSESIDSLPSSGEDRVKLPCYESDPDAEGFCKGKIGIHTFPFHMRLPLGKGAKGGLKCKQGVVKYIVIGSVKLKSHLGTDRSIAHFYRHVDVYPYLEPSVILTPLPTPIMVENSKAIFMGSQGKVKIGASLHRQTWVAGQRCYVDVRVQNGASKKIKSLTISLIRTTIVFRPRPYLTAGSGIDANDPEHADIDPDACKTQTTKKQVAETSLDMGKKATKGSVTAKGMWLGVDAGEEVDFCHFLMIPSDALSMERGRYLEVSYTLKVAVGGSLSSELAVEMPCRIVNFVSLDPPPGHSGPARQHIDPSPMAPQSAPIASSALPAHSRAVERMASMESLSVTDLNRMYAISGMARGLSYDSASSGQLTSSGMTRAHTVASSLASIEEASPPLPANAREVIQKAQARQLRHQMSLDCIGSAIASATARRQGHVRTQSALSVTQTVSEDAEEEEEYIEPISPMDQMRAQYSSYPTPLPEPGVVQLDDLDDVPDDPPRIPSLAALQATPASFSEHVQVHANDWLEYEDESEDEVDLVLQTKHFDSEDEVENVRPASSRSIASTASSGRRGGLLSPTRASSQRAVKSPSLASGRSTPSSPSIVRSSVDPDALRASNKSSRGPSFTVASPTSPVKKGHAAIVSPRPAQMRRQQQPQQQDRLAPPSSDPFKAPLSPRTASQARRVKPVKPAASGSPASVKGRVAAIEVQQGERGKVHVVRKSASLATMQSR